MVSASVRLQGHWMTSSGTPVVAVDYPIVALSQRLRQLTAELRALVSSESSKDDSLYLGVLNKRVSRPTLPRIGWYPSLQSLWPRFVLDLYQTREIRRVVVRPVFTPCFTPQPPTFPVARTTDYPPCLGSSPIFPSFAQTHSSEPPHRQGSDAEI
ncbi:hypothetical protein CFIO01_13160 [Colletotrichum fioriniae PJ7]|uniref:Uncharacterized protein n=1 Tax=Colletotrichum fioriniae PJ7 TaxID=1445577 RepID=A0A010RQ69_9PEZI|nr:hypothetical protein CFIO01_13160 [Colletotrichum fioriniae PJ7]